MQYEKLQEEIKNAMRAHDKNRLSILRQVHGEVKNIEVNERRDIVEADVDAMLKRVLKQTGEKLEGSITAATSEERTAMLKEQVRALGLGAYFDGLIGQDTYFLPDSAHTKAWVLERFYKELSLPSD